jgi:hypothetical protein
MDWNHTWQKCSLSSVVTFCSDRPPFKMAAVTKDINFFNCPLLLKLSSNFNCSYIARSSLTYIPGFFCEIFLSADLYRLCTLGIFWYKITIKSSPHKPLNQIKPNLEGMVPGWVPFKIVSDSPALHSRWLLLLKIEISSIVQCCFSISLNELKI